MPSKQRKTKLQFKPLPPGVLTPRPTGEVVHGIPMVNLGHMPLGALLKSAEPSPDKK
jgi:hypothetical protein